MRADLLHVIVPFFNPRRYASQMINGARFLRHMLDSGVHVHVAECTYGDAPPAYAGNAGITHHHFQAKTVVWVKEALINAAIGRLPRDWKHVAWIDGDPATLSRRPDPRSRRPAASSRPRRSAPPIITWRSP